MFSDFKIDVLSEEIENNLWYSFFKDELEIDTWIDFENKIESVLKILTVAIEDIRNKVFYKGGSKSLDRLKFNSRVFGNKIQTLQTLKKFEVVFLNEFSDGTYGIRLNPELLIKRHEFYIDVDISKTTKKLYDELIHFKKIFNIYFEAFVYPFYENLPATYQNSLSNIDKHYTFNFTPTFEKVVGKTEVTSFLHGKIDSKNNQIVIGINELPEIQMNKKYFLPFTKYFQKLDSSTDYNFLNDYKEKYSSNYTFFFWGHSLDLSDKDYIDEVFEFVKNQSSERKIIIVYHSETSRSQLLINLFNIRGKEDILNLTKNKKLVFYHNESEELETELNKDITPYIPSVGVF